MTMSTDESYLGIKIVQYRY